MEPMLREIIEIMKELEAQALTEDSNVLAALETALKTLAAFQSGLEERGD